VKAHEVTGRDRDVLTYVCRHGACTPQQVARAAPAGKPFFTSEWACYRRLRALQSLGLLVRHNTWWRGAQVVMTSRLGTQFAGIDLPAARFDPKTLEHTLSLVDLSEKLLAKHRGATWLTERELRRDALRVQKERGMGVLSATRPRTPDGMLVFHGKHIAIELDLTPKRSEAYQRIFSAYAGMAGASGVWWFSPSAAVRSRIAALAKQSGMDSFIAVHPWTPTIAGPDSRSLGE